VKNLIGLSPEKVTAALSGQSMLKPTSDMKDILRGFQKFLVNFEVSLLVLKFINMFPVVYFCIKKILWGHLLTIILI
jgi:hypothetical protein